MAETVRITLQATLHTALHIAGPGRTVALVDRPIALDLEGYPFIPASSVRGRLRTHLERLLRAYGEPVCLPPTPDQMCPHRAWPDKEKEPTDGYCLACHIFGSPWYRSAVSSSDLCLTAGQRVAGDLLRSERTSVSINRRLGTAQSERLFAIETTVPDLDRQALTFEGAMVGGLTPREVGWLLAAVNLVVHVGGSKARGMGDVSFRATAVQWRRQGAWEAADVDQLIQEALYE